MQVQLQVILTGEETEECEMLMQLLIAVGIASSHGALDGSHPDVAHAPTSDSASGRTSPLYMAVDERLLAVRAPAGGGRNNPATEPAEPPEPEPPEDPNADPGTGDPPKPNVTPETPEPTPDGVPKSGQVPKPNATTETPELEDQPDEGSGTDGEPSSDGDGPAPNVTTDTPESDSNLVQGDEAEEPEPTSRPLPSIPQPNDSLDASETDDDSDAADGPLTEPPSMDEDPGLFAGAGTVIALVAGTGLLLLLRRSHR